MLLDKILFCFARSSKTVNGNALTSKLAPSVLISPASPKLNVTNAVFRPSVYKLLAMRFEEGRL